MFLDGINLRLRLGGRMMVLVPLEHQQELFNMKVTILVFI